MPSVSHSETDSYLLCRRKHFYGYTMSLQRVRESNSLAMGSLGHAVLEAVLTNKLQKAAFPAAIKAAQEAYEAGVAEGFEQPENRAVLYDTIFNWFIPNEPFVLNGWIILAVEKKFNLQYDDEKQLQYPFVVDAIARDPQGKIVVIDHKFVYDFYTYEASQMQPQIPKYIGALRALGHKVDYGMYNMLRTRLIKGTKDKKTNEYPGPTLEQVVQVLDVKPNTNRVTTVFTEQMDVAEEIQLIKTWTPEQQSRNAWRVANKMVCQSCSFLDICKTELVGGNTKLLIASEYTIRERRTFDVTEEVEVENA